MLDKTIHAHLDKMDDIIDDVENEVADMLAALDIDAVIEDPWEASMKVVGLIHQLVVDRYAEPALKAGQDVGARFENMRRKVVVQKTNDPGINADD